MPTLVLDKIIGAELDATRLSSRCVRSGHINDIELADTNDPNALASVMEFLFGEGIIWQSPLSQEYPSLLLGRIQVLPEPAKTNRVNLKLTYETAQITGNQTVFMVRDRSYSQQVTRCTIPGTHQVITCSWDILEASSTTRITDVLFFNINTTVRAIQITSLQYGRPEGGFADYVNYVNNAEWPTGEITFASPDNTGMPSSIGLNSATSYPIGYWRIANYGTEYNRTQATTLTQAEAITQTIEDWSTVGILRNEKTGKYPFASMEPAEQEAERAAMMAEEYSHGIIWPLNDINTAKGIVKFGAYPLTDFFLLMGF
jgi:hypothetical protein